MNKDWCTYYFLPRLLSPETCGRVIEAAQLYEPAEAIVGDGNAGRLDRDYRRSIIRWLAYGPETSVLYEALTYALRWINDKTWRLDLSHFPGALQYTEYAAWDQQHYDWHMDFGAGEFANRKLSISVLLTPGDEYEGGDFEFQDTGMPDEHRTVLRQQGAAVIFPSFYRHRVTPVTRGKRISLVGWMGGPTYR